LVFSRTPGRVAGWVRDRLSPAGRAAGDGAPDGRRFWALALPLLVLMLLYLVLSGTPLGVGWLLALHLTVFFTACMVCHGELAHHNPDASGLAGGRWAWPAAALLAAGAAGVLYVRRRPDERRARVLDFLLPLALGVLAAGLTLGVSSAAVYAMLTRVAGGQDPLTLRKVLAFGLPALLCFL